MRKGRRERASGDHAPLPAADRRFESYRSTGEWVFRERFGVSNAASWNELDPVGALGRRTHPRLVNEALGRHIERTSLAASRGVNVQRSLSSCRFSRQRNLVIDRLGVVGE